MTATTRTPAEAAKETRPAGPDRPRKLRTRTLDDRASVLGSAAGSLALTWLLYQQILSLFGLLGFILLWYVLFLAMYAAVMSLYGNEPRILSSNSSRSGSLVRTRTTPPCALVPKSVPCGPRNASTRSRS